MRAEALRLFAVSMFFSAWGVLLQALLYIQKFVLLLCLKGQPSL
jgi:hypothetical protein